MLLQRASFRLRISCAGKQPADASCWHFDPSGQVVELVAGHLDKAQDLLALSSVCRATRWATTLPAALAGAWQVLGRCLAGLRHGHKFAGGGL